MGFCGARRKASELRPEQKWDYIVSCRAAVTSAKMVLTNMNLAESPRLQIQLSLRSYCLYLLVHLSPYLSCRLCCG